MKIGWVFIALAMFLLTGQIARAQFSYGAKLGMGFPGFEDEEIASQRITLSFGAVASLKIVDGLHLVTELGFQRKGNKYTTQYWDSKMVPTYQVKTNLDYITIPLFIRINLGRTSKYYLQAGGYYGFLVHANFSGMRMGEMVKRVNIIDGLYGSDYGLVASIGIETPIRQGLGVVLDIKYRYGLKDINKDHLIIGNSKPIRNKGLAISMGIYADID